MPRRAAWAAIAAVMLSIFMMTLAGRAEAARAPAHRSPSRPLHPTPTPTATSPLDVPVPDAEPVAIPDPDSPDAAFPRWIAAVRKSDLAVVMRLEVTPIGSRDAEGTWHARWETRIASQGYVGIAWIGSFAHLLTTADTFDRNGRCDLTQPRVAPDAPPALAIRFVHVASDPSALLLLDQGCISLREGENGRGRLDVRSIEGPLLDMLRDAIPDDSVLYFAQPLPPAPASARALAVTDGDTGAGAPRPRFGDYVYVEELPEAVTKAAPIYPVDASKAGVSGTVLVQALVGPSGRVEDVRIQKSIPMLDAAALAAVRQWTFKPALSKGSPVAVWVAVPVKFSLH